MGRQLSRHLRANDCRGLLLREKTPRRAGHSGRHHPLLPGRLGNRSVDPRQVINANNSFRTLRGNHWLDSPLISDWVRGRARKNISPRLNQGSPDHPYKPAFLYESGIAWTTALPITGVIWYQGESDAEIIDNAQNSMLLKTMISSWRKAFRNRKPFVMIQLPASTTVKNPCRMAGIPRNAGRRGQNRSKSLQRQHH